LLKETKISKKYGASNAEWKVNTKMTAQPSNITWIYENQSPSLQEKGYGVRYIE